MGYFKFDIKCKFDNWIIKFWQLLDFKLCLSKYILKRGSYLEHFICSHRVSIQFLIDDHYLLKSNLKILQTFKINHILNSHFRVFLCMQSTKKHPIIDELTSILNQRVLRNAFRTQMFNFSIIS